jgi:hypothetical protein
MELLQKKRGEGGREVMTMHIYMIRT